MRAVRKRQILPVKLAPKRVRIALKLSGEIQIIIQPRNANPEFVMKAKLQFLFLVLAALAGVHHASAQATTLFPIATNANVVEVASGGANSGTNGLGVILAGTNVCFQLISSNGTLIGPLTTIGSAASYPLAAYAAGEYLVYWDDNFVTEGPSTFGQIISPDGATAGSPFLLPATGVGAPRALASDGTNFLAVMANDDSDYYGQIVTPAGTLSGSQFLISSQTGNAKSAAAVFGKTNYLVVWENNVTGNGDNLPFGAFVSGSGSAGSPFQIGQTGSLDNNPLALAFDGTNYFVIWNVDTAQFPNGAPVWNLYGRLVSQDGTFPGNELLLSTNQPSSPCVAFDGANYLVGWSFDADRTNADQDVFFQFFDPSGNAIGPAFPPFVAQGANAPLYGGVEFAANKFFLSGVFGSLILSSHGDIEGFSRAVDYLTIIPASTAPPTLASPGPLAGTQFPLQLSGTPGMNYVIQMSTNLGLPHWTALATNSPTNETFSFTDTTATNASRFYRAVKQ
jgi:hypothetical protein